ncbi:agmatine deiminase [Shewanella eurypsychrophilus]|uniref:Putative agmatine deiminase n=1 Tax=Shewanella eurypsychrophilus TaxID=2593656 RepID=A0ABX6V6P2_9GAMM|nr:MULTISPECIES: agmatine deiminase [Shewanella]QFU22987.1 agmatine deiminase [Shewanella sp. YLB-09]QPG58273.1 agmatine deiminase [Shewanella eurypsychrophilus]
MPRTLHSTPRQDGFRMPGEFEPKKGCWLGWPERCDVWRNGAKPAQKVWVQICTAIAQSELVTVCVSQDQYENARAMLPDTVRVVEMSTNDAWFRDSACAFLVNDKGDVRGTDWTFNAYGGLNGGLYFPWDKDDLIAQKILEIENLDRYRSPLIAEMGGIQCDGQGTLLTTEQCLLNSNRNGHLNKDAVEQHLRDYMGVEKIIWLPRGCKFDETDGHIDDLACWVAPGELLLQWTDDESDPQYEIYQEAYAILSRSTDARGRSIKIHKIPQPKALEWTEEEASGLDIATGTHTRVAGTKICASYINYYIGNEIIMVPTYDDPMDEPAQAKLSALFPKHKVIGIENAREILLGGGNVACITQPQYAGLPLNK